MADRVRQAAEAIRATLLQNHPDTTVEHVVEWLEALHREDAGTAEVTIRNALHEHRLPPHQPGSLEARVASLAEDAWLLETDGDYEAAAEMWRRAFHAQRKLLEAFDTARYWGDDDACVQRLRTEAEQLLAGEDFSGPVPSRSGSV